jgi:hypothetical protein
MIKAGETTANNTYHTLSPSVTSPSGSRCTSIVMLASQSCAEAKLVTERVGRPNARSTGKQNREVIIIMQNNVYNTEHNIGKLQFNVSRVALIILLPIFNEMKTLHRHTFTQSMTVHSWELLIFHLKKKKTTKKNNKKKNNELILIK